MWDIIDGFELTPYIITTGTLEVAQPIFLEGTGTPWRRDAELRISGKTTWADLVGAGFSPMSQIFSLVCESRTTNCGADAQVRGLFRYQTARNRLRKAGAAKPFHTEDTEYTEKNQRQHLLMVFSAASAALRKLVH